MGVTMPMTTAAVQRSSRDDAVTWILRHAANLPTNSSDPWQVKRPSREAKRTALVVIKYHAPSYIQVSGLAVTLDEGIEFQWQNGRKMLAIEVMADGSLEILESVEGQPVHEDKLPEPDYRVNRYFGWLDSIP